MSLKKSYCISANSKYSRSVDIANGELGTHANIRLVGDNYIVVTGDITNPSVRHVLDEYFHVHDDLDTDDIQAYEL